MLTAKKPKKRFHPAHQAILRILKRNPRLSASEICARMAPLGYTRSTTRSGVSELSQDGVIAWRFSDQKVKRGLPPRIYWVPSGENPPEEVFLSLYSYKIPQLLSQCAMTAPQVAETLGKDLRTVKTYLSLLKADGVLDSASIPDPRERPGKGFHLYWVVGSEAAPTAIETISEIIFEVVKEARRPISMNQIAKETGYSLTTIRRHLLQLMEWGKVTRIDNRNRIYPDRATTLFVSYVQQ